MDNLSGKTILYKIVLSMIFVLLFLLISVNYYTSCFHKKYNNNIQNMNKEIITSIIPFVSPLLDSPNILKKQFEKTMKLNPKIRYILIEKNNKYLLHVTNTKSIKNTILFKPITLTKELNNGEYSISISYYDKSKNENIYIQNDSISLSIIIIIGFLVLFLFIKNQLLVLDEIKSKIKNKIPSSIRSNKTENIIDNITKIIEYNDKNEEELKKLQAEFEDQINIKTASLINEIKERKKAEMNLENSINEKVILLKEVHHRVKNNLTVVIGFIRMQARQITDPQIKDIFLNLQNRVKTMELIHTNLYGSKDFTQINFKSYVQSLIKNIQNTFTNSINIEFYVTCNQIKLDIEQAIACGQIINELITNSFKHVFKFDEKGKISIKLYEEKNLYILEFFDSGTKSKDFYDENKNSKSLGLKIVQELTKYQLKGNLEITQDNGIKYEIFFKKPLNM